MNVRRKRHDSGFRDATLLDLTRMRIKTDRETETHAWKQTTALASQHGLTVYDAAFLELAQRRNLALATLDADLRKAATVLGISLLGM